MKFFARLSVLAAIALSVCFQAALAAEAPWTVVKSSGTVRVAAPNASAQPVSFTNELTPGSIITTGGDGQLLLRSGEQEILVGPNSRMSLPAENTQGVTRVMQDLGTLLFKVDKRDVKHFQVETPIIAAVVKGTTFTVTADLLGDSVHVAEGLVEVRTMQGGAVANVPAGETVFVAHTTPEAIQFRGAEGSGAKSQPIETIQKVENETGGASTETTAAASMRSIPTTIGADALDFNALTDGLALPAASPNAVAAANAQHDGPVQADQAGQAPSGVIAPTSIAASVLQSIGGSGSHGNGLGASNNNAGGNGNGLAIGVDVAAGGNGNGLGVDNNNAGGNGNGVGNGDAGGNGLGLGIGNGDAGGNGNGLGVGNNNAGGIGNRLGVGNGKGNGGSN